MAHSGYQTSVLKPVPPFLKIQASKFQKSPPSTFLSSLLFIFIISSLSSSSSNSLQLASIRTVQQQQLSRRELQKIVWASDPRRPGCSKLPLNSSIPLPIHPLQRTGEMNISVTSPMAGGVVEVGVVREENGAALLPQSWPAKPLKLDSPKLLAQGQLEPRLLQALPPTSWAKSAVLTAAGLQQRRDAETLHHCSGRRSALPAPASRRPPLGGCAQPAPGRPDRTAALIGAAREHWASMLRPRLHRPALSKEEKEERTVDCVSAVMRFMGGCMDSKASMPSEDNRKGVARQVLVAQCGFCSSMFLSSERHTALAWKLVTEL
ncbi:hypothetical protein STEG23_002231 [Scotinomys teguina]